MSAQIPYNPIDFSNIFKQKASIAKQEDDALREIAAKIVPINVHSCEIHKVKGSEILEWETVSMIDGRPIDPDKIYDWRYPVITQMNHYKRLKNIWKERNGEKKMQGVLNYLKYIETVVKRSNAEKENA